MNYRHHFHAGNFADVMKHVVLLQLFRGMQKKEKGYLYLDTHAGRGSYDLTVAATGDSLARKPEWPEGIGRVLSAKGEIPAAVSEYVALVREFDQQGGNLLPTLRFYPGSPWFAQRVARPQDRLIFCEKHPAECDALQIEVSRFAGVNVQETDGYIALRALLPPRERRALILIDPPFEAADEFAQIADALQQGLRRFPTGVFAIWYPLTGRARLDHFFAALRALNPPPTLFAEVAIAGEQSSLRMKGSGLVVINPPWQFAAETQPILDFLTRELAQAPGGGSPVGWVVPER